MNYHAAWQRLTDELLACHGRCLREAAPEFLDIAINIEQVMDLMQDIEEEIPVRLEKMC